MKKSVKGGEHQTDMEHMTDLQYVALQMGILLDYVPQKTCKKRCLMAFKTILKVMESFPRANNRKNTNSQHLGKKGFFRNMTFLSKLHIMNVER